MSYTPPYHSPTSDGPPQVGRDPKLEEILGEAAIVSPSPKKKKSIVEKKTPTKRKKTAIKKVTHTKFTKKTVFRKASCVGANVTKKYDLIYTFDPCETHHHQGGRPSINIDECDIKCHNYANCGLAACLVYKCTTSPYKEYYYCIECQEKDFGGWPAHDELPNKTVPIWKHRNMIEMSGGDKDDMPFEIVSKPLIWVPYAGTVRGNHKTRKMKNQGHWMEASEYE